ncbi:MAG: hypothetical protein N2510_01920, partial [Ignavibacteria bacterium]|nr:hypothetical protein [Ignavibacteria bacterium]
MCIRDRVYTVGLLHKAATKLFSEMEMKKAEEDLAIIASNSGGFFYKTTEATELERIYKQIFAQILKSYQLSIVWNSEKLPPKGTQVKAVIRINVKGKVRTIYKDYVME